MEDGCREGDFQVETFLLPYRAAMLSRIRVGVVSLSYFVACLTLQC